MDIGAETKKALEKALQKRGRVNVLIAGRTGVGKSTLVNAVFQGDLARTGQGRPITPNVRAITKEGVPVTIFDTRGLELAAFRETLDALESLVRGRAADADPQAHIHVAWICISEDSRRVEEAESDLCKMLAGHVPVVGVLTKCRSDQGFRTKVQQLLPEARNVMRVRALAEELDDGHQLPPMGLEDLVELTMHAVPEGQRSALVAAQRVSLSMKTKKAHLVIAAGATSAAAAGAIPIPLSDAFALVPIQITMLAGITATFGIDLSSAFLSTLVGATVTGTGSTLAGRAIAANLLKLVPGAGSAAGSAIAATTAAAVTTAFGEAYLATLVKLFGDGNEPSEDEILAEFKRRSARS